MSSNTFSRPSTVNMDLPSGLRDTPPITRPTPPSRSAGDSQAIEPESNNLESLDTAPTSAEDLIFESNTSSTPIGDRAVQMRFAQRIDFAEQRMKAVMSDNLNSNQRRRGFRLIDRPDVHFLGFFPTSRDLRPYLNAMPVTGPVPVDNDLSRTFLPVVPAQRLVIAVFGLICCFVAAGVAFYVWRVLRHP